MIGAPRYGPKGNLRGHGPNAPRRQRLRRREPTVLLTGDYGQPSWPSTVPPEARRALPRAITRRQAKAEERLRMLGGATYLKGKT